MKKKIYSSVFFSLLINSIYPNDSENELVSLDSVTVCYSEIATPTSPSLSSYFSNLFSTENWPARWSCGSWSEMDGWIYIISDLVIFAAYLSIPLMLFIFLWKRDLGIFKIMLLAFAVFILSCGFTHLIDAIIFWEPVYRFSGFVRMITAIVSVGTVGLMIKYVPIALTYKSPEVLQQEVDVATETSDELNEILQESFQIAKIGTWILDLTTNEVKWSDSLYDLYEIPVGTPIDLEKSLDMYPKQEKLIQDTISNAISNRRKYVMELLVTKPNGKKLWTKAVGIPKVEGDEVVSIRGYVMDIDAHKMLELERASAQIKLEKAVEDRTRELKIANQELESFSYYISHDLRAPLRAINGFSEALMEEYKPSLDETASRYLDRIAYNSRKMGDLIDDILAFSRMSRKETNFRQVNLGESVRRIIDDLFLDADRCIHLGPLPNVFGDKEMLLQVFTNLLSNAIKYSSKEERPKIEVSCEEKEEYVVIKIADNGVGFNMKYADKLFKVFHRLHSDTEFEGTGVGLALSHKIIIAHGGDIWAEGKEGEGAIFYVQLKKHETD